MDKFVIRKPRRLQDSSSTQDADLTQDSSSTRDSSSKYGRVDIIMMLLMKCCRKLQKNSKLTHPDIQKDIVNAVAYKTTDTIIEDLGSGFFSILVDESHTSALSLKVAIEFLFSKYALSLSRLRRQGYDGASNMQVVANKHTDIAEFFSLVSKIVTIVGASYKRREFLRNAQLAKITEALNLGELESGQGLNQETSLKRAGDTRWGSHYRTILNLILMFSSTVDVLEMIEKDSLLSEQELKLDLF
ncbi:uncharacterized protein LOC112007673 [Quercus suber]|uniref:uncharacterized protein LOC112007673 n=1 Tax=Quercus suber TaxID=58331 RepID=UPI0032DEDAC5